MRYPGLVTEPTRRVPKLDLVAEHERMRGEVDAALARVLESQRFIGGPEVAAFEEELAAASGVGHAVGCGSGSDALLLALMAEGIGPGDRVVCPAYTFFSTAAAISRLGAEPVFADIDPTTLCMEAPQLAEAIDRAGQPAAVIVVHLFGRVAAMDALLRLTDQLGVPLVEDAAQSIGARDDAGAGIGVRGRVACLSFYPSKNLGGYGDGGALLTGDAGLAERLRILRDHGRDRDGLHRVVGINSRLDAIQAAVLRTKLRHLEAWTEERLARVAIYNDLLTEAGAVIGVGPTVRAEMPVRLPSAPAHPARHVFNQYVVRVPEAHRDRLRDRLAERRVETGLYYQQPLHHEPCFGALPSADVALPHAEAACRDALALPIHPELDKDQLARVVAELRQYFVRSV